MEKLIAANGKKRMIITNLDSMRKLLKVSSSGCSTGLLTRKLRKFFKRYSVTFPGTAKGFMSD